MPKKACSRLRELRVTCGKRRPDAGFRQPRKNSVMPLCTLRQQLPRSLLAQFRCLAELDYLNCKCGAQDKEGERGRITLCTAVAAGRTGDMSIMRKYKLHSGTQCKLKRVTHLGDREHQRRKIRLKKHLFRKGCSYSYIMTLQVTYAW